MDNLHLNLEFDLEKNRSNVIKVIGVGGGGGNAVNYMYQKGIKDVDFVVINTDAQDLSKSPIPIKIQIGKSLTEGLGAGANPEIGEKAAVEDLEAIRSVLASNTKMIFITAGMGGGTGTGAAPIIAKMAKEMGILTVGIVTSPFTYEGRKRNLYAQKGIENLREYVDSLIIINNNKLREIYGNLTYKEAFAKSDEVLASAATSIAEVITRNYTMNVDFKDVNTVLENSGTAIMGSAKAKGENRSQEVIMNALDSPLLNDNKITGAKNVLLLILSGKGEHEITIDEISEINDYIQAEAGNSADVIMGIGEDESLGDSISVTIIATGFNENRQDMIANAEPDKIVHVFKDDSVSTLPEVDIPEISETENAEVPTDTIPEVIVEDDPYGNQQYAFDFKLENHLVEEPETGFEKEPEAEPEDFVPKQPNKVVEEKTVEQPLLFNLDEKPQKENFDEIEDLSELPIEIALKLRKKRKGYMKNYTTKLPIKTNDEKEVPAFKKKGIDVDLSPKSSKDIHKIEMDADGNFKLRDSNSFLNDNVD